MPQEQKNDYGLINWRLYALKVCDALSEETDKVHIKCPWASEHTGGGLTDGAKDSSILIMSSGAAIYKCLHGHCASRNIDDVVDFYGIEKLKPFVIDDLEMLAPDGTSKESTETITTYTDSVEVTFLGFTDEQKCVLHSTGYDGIITVDGASLTDRRLLCIAPHLFWLQKFPNSNPRIAGIDNLAASEWVITESKKAGPWDSRRKANLGLYHENGVWVYNCGDKIYANGQFYDYKQAWKTHGTLFMPCQRHAHIGDTPLSRDTARQMCDVVSGLAFKDPCQNIVFFATVITATIPGIWDNLPIMFINGPTGSGKTEVIQLIAKPLIEASGGQHFTGGTTRAGLENSIGSSHTSASFDEAEPKSLYSIKVMESVTDSALAATTSGANVVKGTRDGRAISREFKAAFLFGSVGNMAKDSTIERRSIKVSLVKGRHTPEQWFELKDKITKLFTKKNSSDVLRFLIDNIPLLRKNYEIFLDGISGLGHDTNMAQKYATLLSCYYTFKNQAEVDTADHEYDWIDDYIKSSLSSVEVDDELVNKLMTLEFRYEPIVGHVRTVYLQEMLYSDSSDYDDLLRTNGIKKSIINGKQYLLFANKHLLLTRAMEKIVVHGHSSQLSSLPGALVTNVERFSGIRSRAVAVPMDVFLLPEQKTEPAIVNENLDMEEILKDVAL